MPPPLALALCLLFIIWLLRLERKQSPDVSIALWVPTLWLIVNTTKPLAIWLNLGLYDMQEGSPADRIFNLLCMGLGLAIIAVKKNFKVNIFKENIWIYVVLAYMLLSICWSDIPFISFKRWSREVAVLIMALCVAAERNPKEAFKSVFTRLVYIVVPVSILIIKYFPAWGVNYSNVGNQMWMGATTHKNRLCCLCAMSIIFFIWSFLSRKFKHASAHVWYQGYVEVLMMILSLHLFLGPYRQLTNSATSAIAFFLALAAVCGLFYMRSKGFNIRGKILVLLIGCIFVYGSVTPFMGKLPLVDISNLVNRDESLTGRSAIWSTLMSFVAEKPILGFGFGGFWTDAMRTTIDAAHTHNGYLDIMLNMGILGLLLFFLSIIKNCGSAVRDMQNNFDWGVIWLSFLLISLLDNITETSAISLSSPNMALLLMLGFTAEPRQRRRRSYTYRAAEPPRACIFGKVQE